MRNILTVGVMLMIGVFTAACNNQQTASTNNNNNANSAQPGAIYVSALGRVEPQSRIIKLTAPPRQEGSSRLARLLVAEGDQVAENQTVAVLDGQSALRAVVAEAEGQVLIAVRRLEQTRAGAKTGDIAAQRVAVNRLAAELQNAQTELRRAETPTLPGVIPAPEYVTVKKAEVELENAQRELARAEKLSETGDIARAEFDERRTGARTLEKDVESAGANLRNVVNERRLLVQTLQRDIERNRAQLQSVAEVRPTDVRAAEAEVASARAALEKARVDLAETNIRALTSGKVLQIHARPGESIGENGILELGDVKTMFVVAEVFEADITKIKLGQVGQITVRTSGETFQGVVAEIGSIIQKRDVLDTDPVADVDARIVEVRIRLNDDATKKFANLTNLRVDVRMTVG